MSDTTTPEVPSGYWRDANGDLRLISRIKDIDKDRHRVVTELCEAAKAESARLLGFKSTAMQAFLDFLDRSHAQYEVKLGGRKGNATLISFDGRYKIERAISDRITFDERLQAAKELIDECILSWGKGGNANLKAIAAAAFQVNKQGKISTRRVLDLRQHKFDDPRWLRAMQAINDSILVVGTKPYIRFYERDDASGQYLPIVLDAAAV